MADLSALSLQTALLPSTAPAAAAPLENTGNAAEPGVDAGTTRFDALLVQQATMQTIAQASAPDPAAAILPEGGKTLPDAANPVAASLATIIAVAANRAAPTRNATVITEEPADQHLTLKNDSDAAAGEAPLAIDDADILPVPDATLFAAIFAAPERLADAAATVPDQAPEAQLAAKAPAGAVPVATASAPQATPTAVAAAIASTAQIELQGPTPDGAPPQPASAMATTLFSQADVVTASQGARSVQPSPPTRDGAANVADSNLSPAPATGDGPRTRQLADGASSGIASENGMDTGTGTIAAPFTIETPLQPDAPASAGPVRAEARAERIDFATLVDTLNRAREDAAPRTLNVAVTNTDFGRVAMRFDSTDTSLSVAMSAADPEFARAISASSESAATSSDTRGQNAQGSQNPADASTARQQGQHQHQNQPGPTRGDVRAAAPALPGARSEDAAAARTPAGTAPSDTGGIYA